MKLPLLFMLLLIYSCNSSKIMAQESEKSFSILALGDSYTIGESVCNTCNFPEQLKDSLKNKLSKNTKIDLKIIAKTGWTTMDLESAITKQQPLKNYDLVTLLIGVNNQYQNKPFQNYIVGFPKLVNTAIAAANNDKNRVIVISIPDYAYTPFGKENVKISTEIDRYNAFAKAYSKENNISFINITDITKQGLKQPNLVAEDGLHPSKIAYNEFVKRLLPKALDILN